MALPVFFKHLVYNQSLPLIYGVAVSFVPESGLMENRFPCCFGPVKGPTQTAQKPAQPERDIEPASLLSLQPIIVIFSLGFDLGRHAVKAILACVGPCKRHIRNCTRYTAISILKRVNSDKPEMSDPGPQNGVC